MSAAAESGSGEELDTIFPRNPPADNGQGEAAPSESSPVKTRRMSGFADKAWWDQPNKDDPSITNREAKSLWAKDAVGRGLIGGARPGAGRPRKNKSVAEVVTEKSSEKAERIAAKLVDLALNNKSPSINLGAIDRINKFEQDLEKNMRDDEKELHKLSGKSLDQALADVLAEHGIGYDIDLPPDQVEDVS
jgi:hypothetical protein